MAMTADVITRQRARIDVLERVVQNLGRAVVEMAQARAEPDRTRGASQVLRGGELEGWYVVMKPTGGNGIPSLAVAAFPDLDDAEGYASMIRGSVIYRTRGGGMVPPGEE